MTTEHETPQTTAAPVWVRLPAAGKSCPHTGLRRGTLYSLITGDSPKVESRLVNPGRGGRGVRLIRLASLLAFIEKSNP